jgi:ABC-type multidrug transport system fused ATPase/permease subunit
MVALLSVFMILSYFLLRFYRCSLRELKRLESRSISPLQSKVNETLDGIPTIAAFKREMDFVGGAHRLIDNSNRPTHLRTSAEIWVSIRLEIMSSLVVLTVAMLGKQRSVMNPTGYGIALLYSSLLGYFVKNLVKSSAALESEVGSHKFHLRDHTLTHV